MESNSLSIRTRATGDLGVISVEEVVTKLETAIQNHGNF
jgi:threonyl-tRNA synthetase